MYPCKIKVIKENENLYNRTLPNNPDFKHAFNSNLRLDSRAKCEQAGEETIW